MKRFKTILMIILASSLLLSACNLPFVTAAEPKQPTTSVDVVNTLAAMTIQALETRLASSPTPAPASNTAAPATSQPHAVEPTATTAPTNTPAAAATTQVPTAKVVPVNPTSTPVPVPCDRGQFVADLTVPDNTVFAQNTTFTKTWRIKNNGSCTWSTQYALVFDSGNALNGSALLYLPKSVAPGETVDLSVTLKSPGADGVYQGFWKLQNASGVRFGIGVKATSPFWVKILVGAYTGTGTPVVSGVCQIESVAPPAYSEYAPDGGFDVNWKVKNVSGSKWSKEEIDWKYLSGTKLYKREAVYDLPSDVNDGSSINLVLDAVAPSSAGTYTMTWGLVKSGSTLCSMSVTIRVK